MSAPEGPAPTITARRDVTVGEVSEVELMTTVRREGVDSQDVVPTFRREEIRGRATTNGFGWDLCRGRFGAWHATRPHFLRRHDTADEMLGTHTAARSMACIAQGTVRLGWTKLDVHFLPVRCIFEVVLVYRDPYRY